MDASQVRGLLLEREVEALTRGKLTPGSGSKGIKGDVHSTRFHVEAKYRSYLPGTEALLLDIEWLETIVYQKEDRIPVLALEWESGRRLLLLPAIDWELLTDELPAGPPVERSGRSLKFCWPAVPQSHWLFLALEAPEQRWVGLHWDAFAALRRAVQPKEESRSFRRTNSRFGRTTLPSGGTRSRWGSGGFRRPPKE